MKKTQAEWREIEKKSTNKTINASKSQRVNEHLYNSQVCCRTVVTDPTSRKAAVCWTNEFPLNGEKRNKLFHHFVDSMPITDKPTSTTVSSLLILWKK
jgi:hypothetical protein